MNAEITDEMLVESVRAGSQEASGELFDRHWRTVWRAAFAIAHNHEVAEDCASDAFVRAFAGLDTYRGPNFRAWVSRIAVNLTLNHLRRERRLSELGEDTTDPAGDMPVPDQALDQALASLSLERRAIIVLRYWLGYSPIEIAQLLDLPIGTVHSRISRALRQLRERLEVEDVERA
jgi:RNA polymerase sigma-70 factor, ECF subfamily